MGEREPATGAITIALPEGPVPVGRAKEGRASPSRRPLDAVRRAEFRRVMQAKRQNPHNRNGCGRPWGREDGCRTCPSCRARVARQKVARKARTEGVMVMVETARLIALERKVAQVEHELERMRQYAASRYKRGWAVGRATQQRESLIEAAADRLYNWMQDSGRLGGNVSLQELREISNNYTGTTT